MRFGEFGARCPNFKLECVPGAAATAGNPEQAIVSVEKSRRNKSGLPIFFCKSYNDRFFP